MVLSFLLMSISLYFLFFHSNRETDESLGSAAITTVLVLGTGIATYQLLFYDHEKAIKIGRDGSLHGEVMQFSLEYSRSARVSLYGLWIVVTLAIVAIIWITAEMRNGGWFQAPTDTNLQPAEWHDYLPHALAYGGRLAVAIVGLFLVRMQLALYRRSICAYEHLKLVSIALSNACGDDVAHNIKSAERLVALMKHGSVLEIPMVPYALLDKSIRRPDLGQHKLAPQPEVDKREG